eukprot:Gb_04054 [translate_table: standard]
MVKEHDSSGYVLNWQAIIIKLEAILLLTKFNQLFPDGNSTSPRTPHSNQDVPAITNVVHLSGFLPTTAWNKFWPCRVKIFSIDGIIPYDIGA